MGPHAAAYPGGQISSSGSAAAPTTRAAASDAGYPGGSRRGSAGEAAVEPRVERRSESGARATEASGSAGREAAPPRGGQQVGTGGKASSSTAAAGGAPPSTQRPADRAGGAASGVSAGATQSGSSSEVPMSNYAFFVKYTYSNECALLAYNFHELVTKLGIFEHFEYRHDHRLISVTLAYIFYRYQVHHCDMALDLAVTLVYLEEAVAEVKDPASTALREQSKDAFNLICYLAFLAHAFNADRTIRLSDWYKEIGWRSFKDCDKLNAYVFYLFSQVRKFRLRVSETRVKRYIQKLCSVPSQARGNS